VVVVVVRRRRRRRRRPLCVRTSGGHEPTIVISVEKIFSPSKSFFYFCSRCRRTLVNAFLT
jgi:hypothetical protein